MNRCQFIKAILGLAFAPFALPKWLPRLFLHRASKIATGTIFYSNHENSRGWFEVLNQAGSRFTLDGKEFHNPFGMYWFAKPIFGTRMPKGIKNGKKEFLICLDDLIFHCELYQSLCQKH